MPRNPGSPADPRRPGRPCQDLPSAASGPADPPGTPPASTPASPSSGPYRSPGAPAPGEARLVAGRGMAPPNGAYDAYGVETSGAPASSGPGSANDWFTRPSRQETQEHGTGRGRGRSGGTDVPEPPGDGGSGRRGQSPSDRGKRHERREGLVRVEFAGRPARSRRAGRDGQDGRSGRGGRDGGGPGRSGRRSALTLTAVVAASVLAVGTGVALDRLVLPELRSEPTSAGRPAPQMAAPVPSTDLGTRRDAGRPSAPEPTASETAPTLKPLPKGTGQASASPDPTESEQKPGTPTERPTGGTTPPTGGSAIETTVATLTNKERTARGCAPLRIDSRLVTAARRHSQDMAANDYFDHTSRNGDSPWDRMKAAGYTSPGAENIAKGYSTAAAVVEGWMKSPGHRANILNCGLKAIGVGMSGGAGGPWWTQDFGWK
ncbi:CAP domain-containing protein [Actinomadura viridis]|uniref:CAP domain-containing protein n=1 Tax=Actinomadura viridis TaxID=58110 RepID=UPI0036CBEE55